MTNVLTTAFAGYLGGPVCWLCNDQCGSFSTFEHKGLVTKLEPHHPHHPFPSCGVWGMWRRGDRLRGGVWVVDGTLLWQRQSPNSSRNLYIVVIECALIEVKSYTVAIHCVPLLK